MSVILWLLMFLGCFQQQPGSDLPNEGGTFPGERVRDWEKNKKAKGKKKAKTKGKKAKGKKAKGKKAKGKKKAKTKGKKGKKVASTASTAPKTSSAAIEQGCCCSDTEDPGGTTCDLRLKGSCVIDEDYYWATGAQCDTVCCDRGELGISPLTRASCDRKGALGGKVIDDAHCDE